jgi:hypothetical protein
MCPHCGRAAPVVYRGVAPHCTACNRLRLPLDGPSVNMAGKGSQVTGKVANVMGKVIAGIGVALSMAAAGLAWVLSHDWAAVALASLPLLVLFGVIAAPFVLGGQSLAKSGAQRESYVREQAIFAMAAQKGGLLSAWDVGVAIGVTADFADAALTDMAKRFPEKIALELRDDGSVHYRFLEVLPLPDWNERMRVATEGVATAEVEHEAAVERERTVKRTVG